MEERGASLVGTEPANHDAWVGTGADTCPPTETSAREAGVKRNPTAATSTTAATTHRRATGPGRGPRDRVCGGIQEVSAEQWRAGKDLMGTSSWLSQPGR